MSTKPTLKANEAKWGKENVEAGWTLVPNALLVHQASLGLKPMDLNIILQIARFWWDAGKHPYPSKGTLADCIGVSSRTIQKHISELVALGFIERIERRDSNGSKTNIYKLTPLISLLKPYSESMIDEKTQRQAENKARPRMRGKITKKLER